MSRIETCRRAMKEAEAEYVLAARARAERPDTREVEARYRETLESLIAAYDTMRMVSPRHSAL